MSARVSLSLGPFVRSFSEHFIFHVIHYHQQRASHTCSLFSPSLHAKRERKSKSNALFFSVLHFKHRATARYFHFSPPFIWLSAFSRRRRQQDIVMQKVHPIVIPYILMQIHQHRNNEPEKCDEKNRPQTANRGGASSHLD